MAATALFTFELSAKDYYVSKSGNDQNNGSFDSPFKTIAKASSVLKAGDVCLIMEGRYEEIIKPQNDGKKKKAITYKSYKGAKVVIDATETLDNWTIYKDGIFQAKKKLYADVPINNVLYHNNKVLDVARFPNNEDGDPFTFDAQRIENGSGSHFIMKDLPKIDMRGGYFCYLGAHSGTTWSREILSYGNGEIHHEGVDIKQWPYTPHNPTIYRNKNRGQLYLFGKLELLDYKNEWFYDAKNTTIYAKFDKDIAPKKGSVRVNARYTTAEINKNYITMDGLEFFGGSLLLNSKYTTIKNCKIINCSQGYTGLIGISAQSNTASVIVKGDNITMEDNLIEGGAANGIAIYPSKEKGIEGKNYKIHNNVLRYFNTIGIHANAIRSNGERTIITNNSIYSCGRDGVYTSGSYAEVAYNDMFDCVKINNDGGVFYTVGNDNMKHSKIHHNFVHDSYGPEYADGRAAGIYLDNDSKGYDVYNNVIWNVTWSALMFNWYNTDLNFYNNTIVDCGFSMGRWANKHTFERISVINNYSNVGIRDKMDCEPGHEHWIGDKFVNNIHEKGAYYPKYLNKDFTPSKNSPLINAGVKIKGITKGKKPDVGAYESGQKPWKAGASWAQDVFPKDFKYGQVRDAYGLEGQKESENDIFKNNQ